MRFLPFALLLLAGEALGLVAQLDRNLNGFITAALLQGAVWAVAAVIVARGAGRPSLTLILATAALLRFGALAAPVYLSDDVYRYIWDGRVQAAGINPYRYIPTDTQLAPLRDETIFPNINRNNYAPTIYPPVAQMLFFVATRFGETVPAVKLVLVAVEAIGIGALLVVLRTVGRATSTTSCSMPGIRCRCGRSPARDISTGRWSPLWRWRSLPLSAAGAPGRVPRSPPRRSSNSFRWCWCRRCGGPPGRIVAIGGGYRLSSSSS